MQAFTREEFEQAERLCLQRGRWGNADVWRVSLRGAWAVKDFSRRARFFRCVFGVWLVAREYRIVKALDGVFATGDGAFHLDRYAFAEPFFEGRPLRRMKPGDAGVPFFERLEAAVRGMHAKGVVHLDLRNGGNILMDLDGTPRVLDFQSAIGTRWLPGAIRQRLEWIDLSGVYKHWARLAPQTMGEARERILLWQVRNRKWWRVRGYRFSPIQRSLKPFEHELLRKYNESQAEDS